MAKIDHEISASQEAKMCKSSLHEWALDTSVLDYGAIILCLMGKARIFVNFATYDLREGGVITMFPNDVVQLLEPSEDFQVEMLTYSPSMLREASLQIEQTIYYSMREDRCRRHSPCLESVVSDTFRLLKNYFEQPDCTCVHQIVLLELKAFFLGYHDYLYRNPESRPVEAGSFRMRELFNRFMQLIELHYKQCHDVSFYADRLHISSKYLTNIVQQITQHTPKVIISHYVILQIKLQLRSSDKSIKQISDEFHFSDTSFFCRYFKQHTGITPLQFRKA